jgi:hypothetical protein
VVHTGEHYLIFFISSEKVKCEKEAGFHCMNLKKTSKMRNSSVVSYVRIGVSLKTLSSPARFEVTFEIMQNIKRTQSVRAVDEVKTFVAASREPSSVFTHASSFPYCPRSLCVCVTQSGLTFRLPSLSLFLSSLCTTTSVRLQPKLAVGNLSYFAEISVDGTIK